MRKEYPKWMTQSAATVFLALAATGIGCSSQKKETWYDETSSLSAQEEQFIADQQSAGVSPEEARATYARKLFTIRTEGRNETLTLEGDELKQKVTTP